MARLATNSFMILILSTITAVSGCGVMPPGQASTRNFSVAGFTLPVNMVYSTEANIRKKAFGIAGSSGEVQALVSRLVMQTVFDVLEQQGRSALLLDAIISGILRQLSIRIRYEPLECKEVEKDPMAKFDTEDKKKPHCIIIGNTVTALCDGVMSGGKLECDIEMNKGIGNIASYTSFSGTITTTNIIMANWSKEIWQGVVNRALRMLASGPSGSQFVAAFATVF